MIVKKIKQGIGKRWDPWYYGVAVLKEGGGQWRPGKEGDI